ncbi:hypothetical protein Fcan01_23238 [Folsomia candida]|uniref:Uncharacterized protein n=1 Tax=Folsomia candida TaxID=158441 RepID=A0A226D8Z8_FOLCA|nr:hypothetical protein Fcan01_23238 [Folsomia candida]
MSEKIHLLPSNFPQSTVEILFSERNFGLRDKFCSQPKATATSKSVKALIDAANRCIRSMELLHCNLDVHAEQFYIYHIASKLDPAAKDLWEHSLKDNDIIKLADLISFLERHAMALENTAYVASNQKSGSEKKTATVHHTQAPTKKWKNYVIFVYYPNMASVSPFRCKKCNQQHSYLLHNNAAENQRNDAQNQNMHTQANYNSRREQNYERQQGNQQQAEHQQERTSQVFHTQGRSEGISSTSSNGGSSLFYNNSE